MTPSWTEYHNKHRLVLVKTFMQIDVELQWGQYHIFINNIRKKEHYPVLDDAKESAVRIAASMLSEATHELNRLRMSAPGSTFSPPIRK